MSIDQVQERIKINPYNVHEMPVKAYILDGSVVPRGEPAFQGLQEQPEYKTNANDHVQGMQASHAEIERKIELSVGIEAGILLEGLLELRSLLRAFRMIAEIEMVAGNEVVLEFLRILDKLDAQEAATQNHGGHEEYGNQFLTVSLRAPNGHGHGEAADNEDRGVDRAEVNIEGIAAYAEGERIGVAIDGIGKKEAAKEEDFRGEENPHPQSSAVLLLLQRLVLPE
jgi:hypothetical protein